MDADEVINRYGSLDRPRWRAVLEARWLARLREVTELSLAYHHAAAETPVGFHLGTDQLQTQRVLDRAVAARRGLADVEEALGRLSAGTFGRCEQCGSQIDTRILEALPETRYCASCAGAPGVPAPRPAVMSR
ncbi:MAG: TraR/DksA C4-type zinc finger protein [Streptosporangiaceae bacterium]|jgi:RNA polymerase-binding transcription factor DksA